MQVHHQHFVAVDIKAGGQGRAVLARCLERQAARGGDGKEREDGLKVVLLGAMQQDRVVGVAQLTGKGLDVPSVLEFLEQKHVRRPQLPQQTGERFGIEFRGDAVADIVGHYRERRRGYGAVARRQDQCRGERRGGEQGDRYEADARQPFHRASTSGSRACGPALRGRS